MSWIQQVLNMGAWALQAQQMGVAVTAHNVANMNTAGYSRQRLVLEPERPYNYRPGQIGSGVRAASIERVYDQFLGVQLQNAVSDKGRLSVKSQTFERLESVFSGISESGLSTDLSDFLAAWEDLSSHPEGLSERLQIREAGAQLAQTIRGIRQRLQDNADEMNRSIRVTVAQINQLSRQIAEINTEIQRAEVSGQNANDLRDMRDLRLEELAGLVNIQGWENDDRTATVMGPGGPLVMGADSWSLAVQESASGNQRVVWENAQGQTIDVTDQIRSGTLSGYLEMRDEHIQGLLDDFEDWSQDLIWEINKLHAVSAGSSKAASIVTRVGIDGADPLRSSLPHGSDIQTGNQQIHLWVYQEGDPPASEQVTIDLAIDDQTTLSDLVQAIDATDQLRATLQDNRLTIETEGGWDSFAVSGDDANILAAVGINGFFEGGGARDIDVSEAIREMPELIGAGRVDDADGTVSTGDNRVAVSIAGLQEALVAGEPPSMTLEGAYHSLVSELGIKAAGTYRSSDYQEAVVGQLQDQKASVSGVNLDEEMINLMKYQWAYEASARLIQTGGEMMKTVIDMIK